jgi:hypothetical protein
MKEELDKAVKTLTIADAVLTGLGIVFAVNRTAGTSYLSRMEMTWLYQSRRSFTLKQCEPASPIIWPTSSVLAMNRLVPSASDIGLYAGRTAT